jgi:hypothetical protein
MTTESTPLPHARVLGYVGHVSTPTRVKIISARVLQILGWLQILLALALVVPMAMTLHQRASDFARWRAGHFGPLVVAGAPAVPPPAPTFVDYRRASLEALSNSPGRAFVLLVFFPDGLFLVLMAGTVRKGQRLGSQLCFVALCPLIGTISVLGALAGCFTLMYAFGLFREPPSLWAVPALLIFLLLGLALLLLVDLVGYLRWIARHPLAEKPPMPFLPVLPATPPSP